jgi:hypothetical protein
VLGPASANAPPTTIAIHAAARELATDQMDHVDVAMVDGQQESGIEHLQLLGQIAINALCDAFAHKISPVDGRSNARVGAGSSTFDVASRHGNRRKLGRNRQQNA